MSAIPDNNEIVSQRCFHGVLTLAVSLTTQERTANGEGHIVFSQEATRRPLRQIKPPTGNLSSLSLRTNQLMHLVCWRNAYLQDLKKDLFT